MLKNTLLTIDVMPLLLEAENKWLPFDFAQDDKL